MNYDSTHTTNKTEKPVRKHKKVKENRRENDEFSLNEEFFQKSLSHQMQI